MELSDYDILGITPKATFRIVKDAYYELSRIYHPDSHQRIASLTKEDRIIAFKKIKEAYENIKKKLNVVEVDLPKCEINYELPSIEKNQNLDSNTDEFLIKFNKEFDKVHQKENSDNPFSIYYSEPEESKRNINDSLLIIKEHKTSNSNDSYEFGINYVDDHSGQHYSDVRNLAERAEGNRAEGAEKEIVDSELDTKLEQLIKLREEKIETSKEDLEFIEKQNNTLLEIEESKRKVNEERNTLYLS